MMHGSEKIDWTNTHKGATALSSQDGASSPFGQRAMARSPCAPF